MTPEKILSFWLDETDRNQCYAASKELDDIILREFYSTWVSIMDGKFVTLYPRDNYYSSLSSVKFTPIKRFKKQPRL